MLIPPTTQPPLPLVTFVSDPDMDPDRHAEMEVVSPTQVRVRMPRAELAAHAPAHLYRAIRRNLTRRRWSLSAAGLYVPEDHAPPPRQPPAITYVRRNLDGHAPVEIINGRDGELLVLIDASLILTDEAAYYLTVRGREHIAEAWQWRPASGSVVPV